MKRLFFLLSISFLTLISLIACSTEDETPPKRDWYFKVQREGTQIPIENAEIKLTLTWQLGGYDYDIITTDENGEASYDSRGSVTKINCRADGYYPWSRETDKWNGLDDFNGFIYLKPVQ
jgi:hypothetical protein